ncbi:hypothetical protein [Streptomyces griseocarneus]|uniref:hypothetical protein n=1 Tax=Streptomyces griseocarneus TaxID=51201 RepID=UPI00167CEB04|nr:hypothetical protein [Streptomyces griseocarneus]MBZ6475888.1 hypothetical protein [Streptomyces griseocarneus]
MTPHFWQQTNATTGLAAPAAVTPLPEAKSQGEIPAPPAEYQQRITAVTAAFAPPVDAQRLASANLEAEKLDEEFTALYGASHSYTVQVRELRGWIAHLMDQPAVAARWYLHTTGLQMQVWGAAHEITRASADRAVQHWRGVTDSAERRSLATELLPMLATITGDHSEVYQTVRRAAAPSSVG